MALLVDLKASVGMHEEEFAQNAGLMTVISKNESLYPNVAGQSQNTSTYELQIPTATAISRAFFK
jgi:hypothetical protein